MLKERFEKRVDEFVLRSTQFGIHRGLKKEGKPTLDQMIKDYLNGEEIPFSKYVHMFDGFDYESNISGLENLEKIKNQPSLIVANHPYEDPLRGGHGQRIVTSYYANLAAQKEVQWLHGLDKKTLERFTRKRFSQQASTIPVRDDDPSFSQARIIQAFNNKDSMGIYPEGDGRRTLLRGNAKAGQFILISVLKNYKIICVATEFKNETFFLTFEPPLNNEMIKRANRQSNDRSINWQNISDYTMARIASHLPENRRGYYQNYQEIISKFEKDQT